MWYIYIFHPHPIPQLHWVNFSPLTYKVVFAIPWCKTWSILKVQPKPFGKALQIQHSCKLLVAAIILYCLLNRQSMFFFLLVFFLQWWLRALSAVEQVYPTVHWGPLPRSWPWTTRWVIQCSIVEARDQLNMVLPIWWQKIQLRWDQLDHSPVHVETHAKLCIRTGIYNIHWNQITYGFHPVTNRM